MEPPDHYCQLAPFAAAFRQGTPALLYHRLGRGALFTKHRGLTLPTRVFTRQLGELQTAGFRSATPDDVPGAPASIWLTFDDGDTTSLAALEPLRTHGFRAIQFLVADRLGKTNDWDHTGTALMDETQVREWLAAGHSIGSHSMTHARLTSLSPAVAREEIHASRRRLEDRFAVPVETFAYPWGDWTPLLAEEVAAAGYRAAFTTDAGVNDASANPFALKRHTVWCAWRQPRDLWFALTA
ncbi:MAG: polysaccharide deacetylase family protein [Chthoniobacter sp.]|uniref:polysaccharide deacetylase family protein n=1 Tax=Chthoniobacter sp. TaxID=2510640 RepID=UPI0032AB28DB